MKKEFELNKNNHKNYIGTFLPEMEKELNKLDTDRIVTIKKIINNSPFYYYYRIKELGYCWDNKMIK